MGQIPTQCDKKKNCLSHLHEMTRLHFWDKLNYRKNTILIIIINGIWFLIRKKCLKKQQHIHSIWNENFQCNIFLMNKHRPRSVHYSPHSADFTKGFIYNGDGAMLAMGFFSIKHAFRKRISQCLTLNELCTRVSSKSITTHFLFESCGRTAGSKYFSLEFWK